MSFSSDVHIISGKMAVYAEELAANTFIELFSEVIKDTPVDSGRLRGNWQTTKNSPARGDVDRKQKGNKAGPATSEAQSKIKKLGTYYLTNNMPYAYTAEFGKWGTGQGATHKTTRDGFSIQAPYGMVRKNAKRLKQTLRKKAR